MAHFLIAYATKNGHTRKVSNFIGRLVQIRRHTCDIVNVDLAHPTDLFAYDAIFVGGPVYMERFPRALERWTTEHSVALNEIPSGFFSVCLGILQDDAKVKDKEQAIVNSFLASCEWEPKETAIIGGALVYSRYNWVMKHIMHFIASRAGTSTDISKDYDFTDWTEVKAFTDRLISHLPKTAVKVLTESRPHERN